MTDDNQPTDVNAEDERTCGKEYHLPEKVSRSEAVRSALRGLDDLNEVDEALIVAISHHIRSMKAINPFVVIMGLTMVDETTGDELNFMAYNRDGVGHATAETSDSFLTFVELYVAERTA